MKSEDLTAIRAGAEIAAMLPIIKAEVDRQDKALENRIFMELNGGRLSPEAALNAWMEKAAIRKMLKNFETKVRVGQTIGERTKELLETGLPNT